MYGAPNEQYNATQIAVEGHRSLDRNRSREISKVMRNIVPAWFSSIPTMVTRDSFAANLTLWILWWWSWFEQYVHPISISRPRPSTMLTPNQTLKPNIVALLPFIQHSSHLFCAIVATSRRGGGPLHASIGDFREFCTTNGFAYALRADLRRWRRDTEVEMAIHNHLGGLPGVTGCHVFIIVVCFGELTMVHSPDDYCS